MSDRRSWQAEKRPQIPLTNQQREALDDQGRVRLDGRNPRAMARMAARIEANAAACKLPVTEYLALPRQERRRRLAEARRNTA